MKGLRIHICAANSDTGWTLPLSTMYFCFPAPEPASRIMPTLDSSGASPSTFASAPAWSAMLGNTRSPAMFSVLRKSGLTLCGCLPSPNTARSMSWSEFLLASRQALPPIR